MSHIIQTHFLTSYPASLLNRDDAGFAKRIVFGGKTRIRISSQCQKRAWRESIMAMNEDHLPTAVRSCSVFETQVLPAVIAQGIDPERARAGLRVLLEKVVKGTEKKVKDKQSLVTKQPFLMGQREVLVVSEKVARALAAEGTPADLVGALLKDGLAPKTLSNMLGVDDPLAYGVEAAMYGRFVTSDVLARTDSSVSVAHAMTVHAAAPELDFFSVVDDLNPVGGADHIGESELSAGLFYGYLSIDLAALTANLTGCKPKDWRAQDPSVVRELVKLLVRLAATRSPGAKRGSTAPYARSDFVLLEVGSVNERQLANAFLQPVADSAQNQMDAAATALARHLGRQDGMYGPDTQRFMATTCEGVTVPGAVDMGLLDAASNAAMDAALASRETAAA